MFLVPDKVPSAFLPYDSLLARIIGSRMVGLDPDAATYISAVEVADGQSLEVGVKAAINNFIVGCKKDASPFSGVSNWDAIKACCFLAGPRTLNGILVPLKGSNPTNFNFVSGDYARATGLKGDAATKSILSGRNNNADPQNNQHLAVWRTESETRTATFAAISAASISGSSGLITTTTTRHFRSRHNTALPDLIGDSTAISGFWGLSREVGTETKGRYNQTNYVITHGSLAPSTDEIRVYSRAGSNHSNARMSYYSIGEAVDLTALEMRIQIYMDTITVALA